MFSHLPRCVVLNRRISAATTSIVLDDRLGMQELVRQMVALGHRDTGCIAGPPGVDTAKRRRAGFLAGMEEAGLKVNERWVVATSYDEAGGYRAAQQLAGERPMPTALVAASTVAAVGVIAACTERGLRILHDLSINSFDDTALAEYLVPPLSTVKMPLHELGAEGARMLIRQIDGERVPQDLVISDPSPRLMPRASTAAPPSR